MTTTGQNRERYAQEVEARPSRFVDPAAYRAWLSRADAWAEAEGLKSSPTLLDILEAAERGDKRAAKMLPMSEWGESRRHLMTPQTVAANYRLEFTRECPTHGIVWTINTYRGFVCQVCGEVTR